MSKEFMLPGQVRKDYQEGQISKEVYELLCIIYNNFLDKKFGAADLVEYISEEKVVIENNLQQAARTDYVKQAMNKEGNYEVNDFYRQGVKLALEQMKG
ncbi:hypothetical protein JCM16358_00890 [Halanaerocella petrolearia]